MSRTNLGVLTERLHDQRVGRYEKMKKNEKKISSDLKRRSLQVEPVAQRQDVVSGTLALL